MGATDATIFARASGEGKSGVAVFRISGPQARLAAAALLPGPSLTPRRAVQRTLRDPATGAGADAALAIFFAAPNSFTGEDTLEIHTHGSLAVERFLLRALAGIPGLRLAEPGEFARRAFENGRMDLPQIEGLADLIAAETEAQRRLAMRMMQGEASALVADWRARLLPSLARVEAAVDFPEEGEDTGTYAKTVGATIEAVQWEVQRELAGSGAAERVRAGIEVAVVGPPNVGKSSLVNRLAGRDLAIVTPEPGTTRDIIEARLEIEGLAVTVLDTAGLRDAADGIEAEGVRRATERARNADLRLHVVTPEVAELGKDGQALWCTGDIRVMNKCDIAPGCAVAGYMAVSARTGEGLGALVEKIGARFAETEAAASPAAAAARRRQALAACEQELARAAEELKARAPPELLAESLRLALRALERFAGRVDVEELLDVIFAEFCLGK